MPSNIICSDIAALIKCIREVETGGTSDGGCTSIGDGGNSYGPYQIQQGTIDYAARYEKELKDAKATDLSGKTGSLTCQQKYDLSEQIMKANWAQAATANAARRARQWTCQDLARVHNGGPNGHTSKATIDYWNRVHKKCPSLK